MLLKCLFLLSLSISLGAQSEEKQPQIIITMPDKLNKSREEKIESFIDIKKIEEATSQMKLSSVDCLISKSFSPDKITSHKASDYMREQFIKRNKFSKDDDKLFWHTH